MLFTIPDAKRHINSALKKFGAKQKNHWNANGSLYQKFELSSGTQLVLITTPCFDGETIEVKWVWELN